MPEISNSKTLFIIERKISIPGSTFFYSKNLFTRNVVKITVNVF